MKDNSEGEYKDIMKSFFLKGTATRVGVILFLVIAFSSPFLTGCKMENINFGMTKERAPMNAAESFDKAVKLSQSAFKEEAEDALKAVMEDYPLSPYALEAQLLLADHYYETGRWDDAAGYYASFITLHPAHPRAEYATFQKGMSYFKQVLGIDRDQVATRKALFAFEDMMAAYPGGSYSVKAREMSVFLLERLAAHEFFVGSFYFKKRNYKGALVRFREVVGKYPNSELLVKALYFIGLSYDKLGEDKLAAEVYNTLIENYPDSPFAPGAKRKIKRGIKKSDKLESKMQSKQDKKERKEESKKEKEQRKMVSKMESEMEGKSWGTKPLGCYVFSSLC